MATKKLQILGSLGSEDAILYKEQKLTEEQKIQARENIGVNEEIAETLLSLNLINPVSDEDGSLAEDDGTVLVIRNDDIFLPEVTNEDDGGVLKVVDGKWAVDTIEIPDIPEINCPVTSVDGQTGDVVLDAYETKEDASAKLTEAKEYTDAAVASLVNSAPETLDTLGELATAFENNEDMVAALDAAITNKADRSELFSGSWNDLTDRPTIPDPVTDEHINSLVDTKMTGVVKTVNGVEPDTSGNVEIKTESVLDENGKLLSSVLPEGYPINSVETEVIFDGVVTTYEDEQGWIDAPAIEVGKRYTVIWDGVEYPDLEVAEGYGGALYLEGDTPFHIYYTEEGYEVDYTEAGDFPVKIFTSTGTIIPMSETFIPDTIARTSDIPEPYALPIAGDTLGGVKNGGNVVIGEDGVMNVDIPEVQAPVTSVNGQTGDVVIDIPEVFSGSWEDLTNRPFGEETLAISIINGEFELAEISQDSGSILYSMNTNSTLGIPEGETYKVVINGVEYIMTAKSVVDEDGTSSVYLGNAGLNGTGSDTGEDFIITCNKPLGSAQYVLMYSTSNQAATVTLSIAQQNVICKQLDEKYIPSSIARISDIPEGSVQADWNQNNPEQPDYVKNRTHWEEIIYPTAIVDGEFELVETQNEEGTSTGVYTTSGLKFILERDAYYKVIKNGTEFIFNDCLVDEDKESGVYGIAIGNLSLISESYPNTGEDFYIIYTDMSAVGYGIISEFQTTTQADKVTLSIYKGEKVTNTIDIKYLPEQLQIGGEDTTTLLTWNGDTDGRDSFEYPGSLTMYKISDLTPTHEELFGGTVTVSGEVSQLTEDMFKFGTGCYGIEGPWFIVVQETEASINSTSFSAPSTGIYFASHAMIGPITTSLKYGSDNIVRLDEKYIPDTIARVADVPSSWNDLEDRPFYGGETILVDATEIDATVDGVAAPFQMDIVEGNEYIVVWDNVSYVCTAYIADAPSFPFIGNATLMGATGGNDEPFYIVLFDGTIIIGAETEGTHTVQIIDGYIKAIDEKFIPDTIARVSDIPDVNAPKNEFILNSSTEGSTKKFKITIDDEGVLTATEIVESAT